MFEGRFVEPLISTKEAYNSQVKSITASDEYVVVNYQTQYGRGKVVFSLSAYKMRSWEFLAEIDIHESVYGYDLSYDGKRMLTNGWRYGRIDLYDMSKVAEGKIIHLAFVNFNIESYFCQLSMDGESVCISFHEGNGVTFFKLCGSLEDKKQEKSVAN